MKRSATLALLVVLATGSAAANAQELMLGGRFDGPEGAPPPVDVTAIPASTREAVGTLITQDYQGRMKPVDTLARQIVNKVTKKFEYGGLEPLDLVLSFIANPQYWWDQPLLHVRYPGLRDLVGAAPGQGHVSPRSLFDDQGRYRLAQAVEEAHQTPDRDRSKTQRKLLDLDERLNILYMAIQGRSLQLYPVPGDPNNAWVGWDQAQDRVGPQMASRYALSWGDLVFGLQTGDAPRFARGVAAIRGFQETQGAQVLPGGAALAAELMLNRLRPFSRILWIYLVASLILLTAFFLSLLRRDGAPYTWRHPLFASGWILFLTAFVLHLAAYSARWLASGRAPLSNGYESLLFISLAVALAGILFEWWDRRGAASGLSSLLAFLILGISMASFFDPAIGLLVPVLNSYWLNIHVTVISASYGFLGLGALVGGLMLVLYLFKAPGRLVIRDAIGKLEGILFNVNVVGLGLMTVGTMLGGVWANESWGRYWGWDPKETWSLVTILAYTVVSHIRLIPRINKPWVLAAGSFAAISTVIMTFFGVNYFLQGLHSYAQGGATKVPAWVYITAAFMAGLIIASRIVARQRTWTQGGAEDVDAASVRWIDAGSDHEER